MFIVNLKDQPAYTIIALLEYERRELRGNKNAYNRKCYQIKKRKGVKNENRR